MKMTLRWHENSHIKLDYIRQIPCITGIVSEVSAPVGSVWPQEKINQLKEKINNAGLEFEVVESVKIHEDIKLGLSTRDEYIDHFIQNIKNLSKAGIKVICYDFMPVFDWMRTQTHKSLPDGSNTLVYYAADLENVNPLNNDFALEDWSSDFSSEELSDLFCRYRKIDEEKLWENLGYFLNAVIPVAEKYDVKLGMHPDDPPWPLFGLPRIITCEKNIDRLLSLYDSPYNSLTLCSGSLGAGAWNDVPRLIRKYLSMDRICFGHVRNVKLLDNGGFEETSHYRNAGSLDIVEIMKAYHDGNFQGYLRPDHGRMIWGESGIAGYGLYDRALGAMYLSGIWDCLSNK